MDRGPDMPPAGGRTGRRAALALVAAAVMATTAACGGQDGGDGPDTSGQTDRQAEVAERGAQVMPFDLDATTHRFEDRDDGLVQTVVADDADDGEQVTLVRRHLADEAARFAAGDLDDPAAIHGEEMPGLADLVAGADDIDITYADVTAGGRITYTTDDPALVTALHRWGAAQVTDHGDHAEHADDSEHAD